MITKNKFKMALLTSSICISLTGCWSIVGVEKSLVKNEMVNMQYFYIGIGALTLLFFIQILLLKKRIAQKHLGETISSAIVFTVLSYTIVGAFNAWLWGAFTHWSILGIIITVLLSFIGGVKGLFPIMGFILYLLYKDTNLLYYLALPNTIGYAVLTVILFFGARSNVNNEIGY